MPDYDDTDENSRRDWRLRERHADDAVRLAKLESHYAELRAVTVEEAQKRVILEQKLAETERKITRAETWGRAVMWTAVGLFSVMTQFEKIVAWIKRI